jgi:hypothetical protein
VQCWRMWPVSTRDKSDGRNSSSAFAISSGTIGATLGSSFSSYPSIALSYGVVQRPVPANAITLANEAAVTVVERLWADWGVDQSQQRSLDGSRVRPFRLEQLPVSVSRDPRPHDFAVLPLQEALHEQQIDALALLSSAAYTDAPGVLSLSRDSTGDTWHTGSIAAKKPSTEGRRTRACRLRRIGRILLRRIGARRLGCRRGVLCGALR